MVLLRPTLRSTAVGGGPSCGGPSIPLPSSVFLEPEHRPPGPGGLWQGGGNDLAARGLNAPCSGPVGAPRHAREEGFPVPRRTVCGEAVERSVGRSGTVNPSSTYKLK